MKLPEEIEFIRNARLPQKTTDARLDGKITAITGATSGVGRSAAEALASAGSGLILVCRNRAKAESAADELRAAHGITVRVVIADLARLPEVRKAADEIAAITPRLHILVNNAGLHLTTRHLTPEGNELVFTVNHLASFLLTRALIPLMQQSWPARIIQVNSQGHRFGGLDLDDVKWEKRRYRGIKGYGASKTAQLLTVWELSERLAGTGVTINAMHPGAVKSNIGADNGALYGIYNRFLVQPLLKDPSVAGSAIRYLAAAPEQEQVSGLYYNLTIQEMPAKHARDRVVGRRVWDLSVKLTESSS